MPISRQEFEKGEKVPSADNLIGNFLLQNPDRAFTVDEILKEIMPDIKMNFAYVLTANEALRRLIGVNLAEARRFSNPERDDFKIYYMAKAIDKFKQD